MSELYLYCRYESYFPYLTHTEYIKLGKDIYNRISEKYYSFTYIYSCSNNKRVTLYFTIQSTDELKYIHDLLGKTEKCNKNLYDIFKSYDFKIPRFIEMKKFCDNIINTNRVLDKKDIDCHNRYEFANDGKKSLIKLLNPNYK